MVRKQHSSKREVSTGPPTAVTYPIASLKCLGWKSMWHREPADLRFDLPDTQMHRQCESGVRSRQMV